MTLAVMAGVFYSCYKIKKYTSIKAENNTNVSVNTDTRPFIQEVQHLKKELQDLPEDLLLAITGSVNTHKGKLGELVGYMNLKAQYDRIIPLGNIVDFVCLKFSTDKEEGYIDFVDVKTGDSARLSKDQRALKQLITNKRINFKTIKIDTVEGYPDDRADTDK